MVLGQHVMPGPSGHVEHRAGTTQAAADMLRVTMFGRGAHGSMPEANVDPVVMVQAHASGAPRPPLIEHTETFPLTVNDPSQTERVAGALREPAALSYLGRG